MTTIKSYTDLEQSKKLAKILPVESADMHYGSYSSNFVDYPIPNSEDDYKCGYNGLPCWSLASLLGVLPVIIGDVLDKNALRLNIDKGETDFNVWYINIDSAMVEEGLDIIKNNAVDACYEMILKLKELNLLLL